MPASALASLLRASAGGDRRAFARLYDATAPQLFAVALRILKRRDWAEDALQEAYVSLWHHAASYRAERGAPLAWMATIVRNRALDRLRRRREGVPLDAVPDFAERADPGPTPLEQALRSDAARALQACLDRLGERQRQAILLAYFDGLTHEELAAHLGVPLGTAKSWVRRGMERVRECLER
jgi:RNA polymerase sigma-70 factor (ECF subfamily)